MRSQIYATVFWVLCFAALVPSAVSFVRQGEEGAEWRSYLPHLLCFVCVVVLFGLRWDRVLRLPDTTWTISLVGVGMLLGVLSLVLPSLWLASLGTLNVTASFLSLQRQRDSKHLNNLIWIFIPLLALPAAADHWLLENLQSSMLTAADGILRFLRLPHFKSEDAIVIPGSAISVHAWADQYLSPRTFILFAMLWSTLLRRHPLVAIANLFSGLCWWFVYHASMITVFAYLHNSESTIADGTVIVLSLFAIVLLFLSSERGIRGLLAPVRFDGPNQSHRVNPLVQLWNQVLGPPVAKGRTALVKKTSSIANFSIATVAIAVLVLQFVMRSNQEDSTRHATRSWSDGRILVNELVINDVRST